MAESGHQDVTLNTLHEDLTAGFGEMRAGFADLKATLVTGFRSLPSRESSEEMVRLLREGNRLQEARFAQLDVRIREQHLEAQQVLHALAEGQRSLVESQRSLVESQRSLVESQRSLAEGQRSLAEGQHSLVEGQRSLVESHRLLIGEVRSLSADIKALIARLDALIKGRGDGSPPE